MRIIRSEKTTEEFAESLDKIAKDKAKAKDSCTNIEDKLEGDRDEKSQKSPVEDTEEKLLEKNREDDKSSQNLIEKNLRKKDAKKEEPVLVEKKLNEEKKSYPHRNEEAYKRTGNKRPVNALDEEMGSAGDEAKKSRYEKAYKGKEDRILDKNVGEQLTNNKSKSKSAFNLKSKKEKFATYFAYKEGKTNTKKLAELSLIDKEASRIMNEAHSQGRFLTDEECNEIDRLKRKKTQIMGLK